MSAQHDAQTSYSDTLSELLARNRTPPRILDVGCGDCSWLKSVSVVCPEAVLVGVDIGSAPKDLKGFRMSYHQASGLDLPFPTSHFDSVHTRKLLSSVSNFDALVAETVRVLRPGGLGVWIEGRNVSTSARSNPSSRSMPRNGMKSLIATQLSRKMLESKGLDADLATSLPKLLDRHGLAQVGCEKLSTDGEHPSLGTALDGAVEGSAVLHAFCGRKRPVD